MKRLPEQLLAQRLLALFAAGWLLWDFPLLRLWLSETTVLAWHSAQPKFAPRTPALSRCIAPSNTA